MGRHATAQRERRGESGGAEGMGGGGVWGVVLGTPHRHEGGKEEGRGGSPWDPTAALDGGCGRSSDNAESLRSSAPAAGRFNYKPRLFQSTSIFSKINEELYICKIINKNRKNNNIKNPMTRVVPQPGATLPYSEFKGLKISPSLVFNAIFKVVI
jgi:hypothetical protein